MSTQNEFLLVHSTALLSLSLSLLQPAAFIHHKWPVNPNARRIIATIITMIAAIMPNQTPTQGQSQLEQSSFCPRKAFLQSPIFDNKDSASN